MRFFITLSYDGTRFHGWQVQPNGISVQGELEKALSLILRADIQTTGAGRTDAGVHARMMVAHFDFPSPIDCGQLCRKLNRLLPRDIAVSDIREVSPEMHARFSATARTYRYYVYTAKDPFLRHYAWHVPYTLDFGKMNAAASLLPSFSDFACFCKSHADVKTTLCSVSHARWTCLPDGRWQFEIRANRFLRNMVRAVVGTLVEVGRGRMTVEEFREVVLSGKRSRAGESVPGEALFLEKIEYEGFSTSAS